jgi:hypothetical protein
MSFDIIQFKCDCGESLRLQTKTGKLYIYNGPKIEVPLSIAGMVLGSCLVCSKCKKIWHITGPDTVILEIKELILEDKI